MLNAAHPSPPLFRAIPPDHTERTSLAAFSCTRLSTQRRKSVNCDAESAMPLLNTGVLLRYDSGITRVGTAQSWHALYLTGVPGFFFRKFNSLNTRYQIPHFLPGYLLPEVVNPFQPLNTGIASKSVRYCLRQFAYAQYWIDHTIMSHLTGLFVDCPKISYSAPAIQKELPYSSFNCETMQAIHTINDLSVTL